MKKIILSLVFLVSILGLFLFRSGTQVSNEAYAVYTNQVFGYEITYPTSFGLDHFTDYGDAVSGANQDSTAIGLRNGNEIGDYQILISGLSVSRLDPESIRAQFSTIPAEQFNITPARIGGRMGYKAEYIGQDEGVVSDFYFVETPASSYMQIAVVKNSTDAKAILSSLKFVL